MRVGHSIISFLMYAAWLVAGMAAAAATGAVDADLAAKANEDDHLKMAQRIDEFIETQWTIDKVSPAPLASDSEFLRRASLDLTGVIPRVSEVREFLADERPDKRARLIERLLASPRYATHMATTWRNRILPLGVDPARAQEAIGLQKWLRSRFASNLRYDNIVGGLLLTAGGDELGPALYYQANDLAPEKIAATTAELFMGVDLECAQCHDHPYADWSQRDFWGMAAFFARVKSPVDQRMGMNNPYRLVDTDQGEVQLPDSNEVVPPKYPRGDTIEGDQARSRRVQLAIWMTSRGNDFFARAAVNSAWAHLFGRGLVDSIDDADKDGDTGHGQLLNELARYFAESGFDHKKLWLTLASTRTYQLSSHHEATKSAPQQAFARMLAKPLTPEQLYDSLMVLAPPRGIDRSQANSELIGGNNGLDEDPARMEFVRRMRSPPGDATEYRAGTLQALLLMNGTTMASVTAYDGDNLLGAIEAPFMEDKDRVESLFMSTLSRPPDAEEEAACMESLNACPTADARKRALSDIFWALLNSTEFAFNH